MTSLISSTEKVTSGYFYSTSYEGMAGYCAVITPELTDVSHSMTKKLNIINFSHHSQTTSSYETAQNKNIINNTNSNSNSNSNTLFTEVVLKKQQSQQTKLQTTTKTFKHLYTYLD